MLYRHDPRLILRLDQFKDVDIVRYSERLAKTGDRANEDDKYLMKHMIAYGYELDVIRTPTVFLDKVGAVMSWYLPEILTRGRQVRGRHHSQIVS